MITRPAWIFPALVLGLWAGPALPGAAAQTRPSDELVNKAVARGVDYLRSKQDRQGVWYYAKDGEKPTDWQYDAGATALIGLALLESDVSPKDPAIVAAVRAIRNVAPKLTKTYPLSLSILFLDRYGGASEVETIRMLAYRLVAGQDAYSWGWKYECPIIRDYKPLLSFLRENRFKTDFGKFEPKEKCDNSNTQFAVMALWVARRHNVPTDYVLARTEARFRNTQHKDGGWGYHHDTEGSTPGMTCSGLLGLAIGYGNARERKAQLRSDDRFDDQANARNAAKTEEDIRKDPMVLLGKDFLAKQLARKPHEHSNWPYFLWSLERVGVTYGFDELGKVNWYTWGAAALVERQREDGSWEAGYPDHVNTAFALLFLRRANLARDLSGHVAQLRPQANRDFAANAAPREIAEADAPAEAARLAKELPQAKPARQSEIISTLRDTKDGTGSFTQVLIEVIPRLHRDVKEQARAALAARFARQPVASLQKRLADKDPEVQLAAARAAEMKEAQELVPQLITLLEAGDREVAAGAQSALKAITRQEFGDDVRRWREYWAKAKR